MSQQIVLSVGRTQLRIFRVEGNARVTNLFESVWSAATIDEIFAKLQKAIGKRSVRVLLDDDISYVFTETVPNDVQTERQWLLGRIQERIPEELNNANWDFREIKKVPGGRQVIIFAPNESIWNTLTSAATTSGITIEAVEPVLIASKRHANPVVGLALKQDLRGDDAKVLNITSSEEPIVGENASGGDEKKQFPKTLVVAGASLFVFVVAGVGLLVSVRKPRSAATIPKPSQQSTVSETPTATPSAIPTIAERNLQKYSLQILNGSGIEGEAGNVANTLKAEGFSSIDTGNADAYEYSDVVVQQKIDVPAFVYETIDRALNGDYTLKKGDVLTNENKYDVLIVVGKKK